MFAKWVFGFSGYFVVDGRLYCEVHAKQIAQPPGPNMKAVPVYRWKKLKWDNYDTVLVPSVDDDCIITLTQHQCVNLLYNKVGSSSICMIYIYAWIFIDFNRNPENYLLKCTWTLPLWTILDRIHAYETLSL